MNQSGFSADTLPGERQSGGPISRALVATMVGSFTVAEMAPEDSWVRYVAIGVGALAFGKQVWNLEQAENGHQEVGDPDIPLLYPDL